MAKTKVVWKNVNWRRSEAKVNKAAGLQASVFQ